MSGAVDGRDVGGRLIFLISLPRSGSTLLQHVIAGHPAVGSTAEPWILLPAVYALRANGLNAEYGPQAAHTGLTQFLEQLTTGQDRYYAALRGMALELYGAFLDEHKKERFLDKTTRNYLIVPELVRMFPEARYVFLLRNPLAVLASYLDVMVRGDWRTLANAPIRSDLLHGFALMRRAIRLFGEHAVVVTYERLVSEPEGTTQGLCDALQLEYVPSMVDYGTRGLLPGRLVDPKSIHRHHGPVSDYAETWRTRFRSDAEIELAHAFLAHLGRPLVDDLGYVYDDLERALPPRPRSGRRLDIILTQAAAHAHDGRRITTVPRAAVQWLVDRSRGPLRRMRGALGSLKARYRGVSAGPAGASSRISSDYRLVDRNAVPAAVLQGWQASEVSDRQLDAYRPLLEAMHRGNVRRDLAVAAECLRLLPLVNPTIVEIGCGNGYYAEVFAHLYQRPFRYVGADYSHAMAASARRRYPAWPFVVADAATLPLPTGGFDVAWSGTILMHLPDYERAIQETRRVSRRFCVFHSVPVRLTGPTLFLTKKAYGVTVAEVLINRADLEACLRASGLIIRHVLESLPYWAGGLAADVDTLSYVCERTD